MSILPRLFAIYRSDGYEPLTGYNPYHFGNYMDAPFTKFLKDSRLHGIAGLSLQEVMFLEPMGGMLKPRNILVIGNAQGWSTLALALIFPKAKVVAIDPGLDGNALTNSLARAHKLNVVAVDGYSPQDVGRIRAEHLPGKADLVLIDAIHTNEAVLADFAACHAESHDGTITLFHDIMNLKMVESIQQIKETYDLTGHVLTKTSSGMAVTWKTAPSSFKDYVQVFTEDPEIYRGYRRLVIERLVDKLTGVIDKL